MSLFISTLMRTVSNATRFNYYRLKKNLRVAQHPFTNWKFDILLVKRLSFASRRLDCRALETFLIFLEKNSFCAVKLPQTKMDSR